MRIKYNERIGYFEVDPLNDFMNENGALYVPGAEDIKANIRKSSNNAKEKRIRVYGASDRHFYSDEEISETPNYKTTYNPHAMDGTYGQKRIQGLVRNLVFVENKINEKGDIRIYSQKQLDDIMASSKNIIFEKQTTDVESNPYFEYVMNHVPQKRFVVYGVATELCVKKAVEALLNLGKKVTVIKDAIAGISPEECEKTLKDFEKRGVRIANLEEILEEK